MQQPQPVVLQLHQALFPSAYIGEADFVRALDAAGDRVLFVARADDAAVGYLYVQDDPTEQEAYVDTDPDDLIQNLSLLCSGYLADPGEA